MPDQLTLQDAIAQGHAGATLASEAAGIQWLDYATAFVRTYLEEHDELFCDDLWEAGLTEPVSPRAIGAVLGKAARAGWMEEITTDLGYIACRRSKRSRGSVKPVWRSLLR